MSGGREAAIGSQRIAHNGGTTTRVAMDPHGRFPKAGDPCGAETCSYQAQGTRLAGRIPGFGPRLDNDFDKSS